MIRFPDAVILAYTKLRTHKIRTGISVGIAGLMFGLIVAMIIIIQGMFTSLDRFGDQSLTNRTVMHVGYMNFSDSDSSVLGSDAQFIDEVQALRAADVAKRTAAAKKYGVTYNPEHDSPSSVTTDKNGRRHIDEASFTSGYVAQALEARQAKKSSGFAIDDYLSQYSSATVLDDYRPVGDGNPVRLLSDAATKQADRKTSLMGPSDATSLMVIDGRVTEPFMSSTSFDPSKGEVPVIIPYGQALSLLGVKAVDDKASSQAKLDQLRDVRQRVGEITVSFCYRNEASQQLLQEAEAQAALVKQLADRPGYQPPALQYAVPTAASCGPVTVARDDRSAAEKQSAAAMEAYQKEVGDSDDPFQYKVTLRGVGIVGDQSSGSMSSMESLVQALVGSSLGYGTWAVPADLLAQLPAAARPDALFSVAAAKQIQQDSTYLVEFSDPHEARQLMERANQESVSATVPEEIVAVSQFGSNSLMIDDMKQWVNQALFWALIFTGGVAVIIMTSMIGRTVADGRRESAVFRAIGAKRSDIAGVYGVYALLLSLRAAAFALILGAVIALIIDRVYGPDATVGAHLAYMSAESSTTFSLFNLWSVHLLVIVGVMVLAGLLASIIPIARSARRNPINDMRDDT